MLPVSRRGARVRVAALNQAIVDAKGDRASNPHYAARLALPNGIAFNVWHETLGESRVAAHGAAAANGDADVSALLCVGEPYYVEVPASAGCARRRRASSSSRRRGAARRSSCRCRCGARTDGLSCAFPRPSPGCRSPRTSC